MFLLTTLLSTTCSQLGTPILTADQGALRLFLEVRGVRTPFDLTPKGIQAAQAHLDAVLAADPNEPKSASETSPLHRVLELLADPENLARLEASAALSNSRPFPLVLLVTDYPDRVFPGEPLYFVPPDPGQGKKWRLIEDRVREGESLEQFAARHDNTVEEVTKFNRFRFATVPSTVRRPDRPRELYIGHRGSQEDSEEMLVFTVFHEAAHLGENSSCGEGIYSAMGSDGIHHPSEIISPAAAFREGWADFQAANRPGLTASQRWYSLLGASVGPLRFEIDRGVYRVLNHEELTLGHFLSNELSIARILLDIQGLPHEGETKELGPFQEWIDGALLLTQGTECRTLADLLGALRHLLPRQSERIEGLVRRRTLNLGSDAEYAALLRGQLPQGIAREGIPELP